jgi:UDP-N-acetylglucosamine 2-epimerase (non-hydrolysing)
MVHLTLVAGARPNFMKIAPLIREINNRENTEYTLIHTGQHYDVAMSDVFFDDLGIPQPDFHLDAGGGTHAEQTASIMVAFEKALGKIKTDSVVVVGDVNSTIACALVAKKARIHVAHVEAGLRSGDMAMPEEINRILTDSISDDFFVTEPSGMDNLLRSGFNEDCCHYVGHVMVDNLFYQVARLKDEPVPLARKFNTNLDFEYAVLTLHRPSNVDDKPTLERVFKALGEIALEIPIVFPAHPRTAARIREFGINMPERIELIEPLGYMEFLALWQGAKFVLTDSGGLQEETTALGIPCVTLRENTERPITVKEGTNILVGTDEKKIVDTTKKIMSGEVKKGERPRYWDGDASVRIIDILERKLA